MNAWDFVKKLKPVGKEDPWLAEDWSDFYHAINDAIERIARRHGWVPKGEVTQEQLREYAELEIPL